MILISHRFLLRTFLLACASCAMPASATDWENSAGSISFRATHRTSAVAADFNNNDLLDIYYGGQCTSEYVGYEWQVQSNLYYNNGDGTFNDDGIKYNGTGLTAPRHNIPGSTYNSFAAIDFDNDGNVDMIAINRANEWDVMGYNEYGLKVMLIRNNGDGSFSVVSTLDAPDVQSNQSGDFANYRSIAVGDYDHDGFADILLSYHSTNGPFTGLYHNNGDGTFSLQTRITDGYVVNSSGTRIAGFITDGSQATDNLLQGAGNVWFVDLNNDGWLDIVVDGAESHTHCIGGNLRLVYLNNLGTADHTSSQAPFTGYVNNITSLRKAESAPVDIDGDGYFDWFSMGYDQNWTSAILPNQWASGHVMPFGVGADNVAKLNGVELNLPGDENCRPIILDFNDDGKPDIFFNNKGQGLWEGAADGWQFSPGTAPYSGLDSGVGIAADFNNDGLPDILGLGYGFGPEIYYNTSSAYHSSEKGREMSAIVEAPAEVSVSTSGDQISISWETVSDAASRGLGYNIILTQDDKTIALIPANPETGFIKTGAYRQTAIRPTVNEYTLTTSAIDTSREFNVGVQTVNVAKGAGYSQFTMATNNPVSSVADASTHDDRYRLDISERDVTLSKAGSDEWVNVYDISGRLIASGLTNQPIAIGGNGIFIITTESGSFAGKVTM